MAKAACSGSACTHKRTRRRTGEPADLSDDPGRVVTDTGCCQPLCLTERVTARTPHMRWAITAVNATQRESPLCRRVLLSLTPYRLLSIVVEFNQYLGGMRVFEDQAAVSGVRERSSPRSALAGVAFADHPARTAGQSRSSIQPARHRARRSFGSSGCGNRLWRVGDSSVSDAVGMQSGRRRHSGVCQRLIGFRVDTSASRRHAGSDRTTRAD